MGFVKEGVSDTWDVVNGIFIAGVIVGLVIFAAGKSCASCNVSSIEKHKVQILLPGERRIFLKNAIFEAEKEVFYSWHWNAVNEITTYCRDRDSFTYSKQSYLIGYRTISFDEIYLLSFFSEGGIGIMFSKEQKTYYFADSIAKNLRVRGKNTKTEKKAVIYLQEGKKMSVWIDY